MAEHGILAVWNNRDPKISAEYERWYIEEHLPERLAVPGFHFGRRYQTVDSAAAHQFFTYYETRDMSVFSSPQYKACLAAPSRWTQFIMAHWWDMVRALAVRVDGVRPGLTGGYAVVARVNPGKQDMEAVHRAAKKLFAMKGVLGGEVWQAVDDDNRATTEAGLRSAKDENIGAALVLHLAHAADAAALLKASELTAINAESVDLYQLICALEAPHRFSRSVL